MAVKTITIDLTAYETLSRLKRNGESFSDVIKKELGRRRRASDLLAGLDALVLSRRTLVGIDAQVKARRRSRAPAARI